MGFLTRLTNGWELAKLSFKVIDQNRYLLLFPVISITALILVLATFFGGTAFIFGDQIDALLNSEGSGAYLAYFGLFLFYIINYFVIVFFNSALIHCAVKTLEGDETSLGDGISFAATKVGKIFAWSVVSATVGVILQAIQNSGKVGEIIGALIGTGWSILTFFVTPILIYEEKDVFATIKESGRIMKEKWGESLSATVSFGLFHFLGILAAGLVGFGLFQIHPGLGIIVAVLLFLTISTIIATAKTVFVAAVYNHVSGRPTGEFDGETLDSVFMHK